MRSRRSKSPPQGLFNWSDVVKYLEQIGALNKKYDSNLDGVVDKSADADTVGGHAPGTSAGDVLVLNTAGQVPISNLPPIPDSQLDFSFAWEKVAEVDVSSAVASTEITGLSGDSDILYMMTGYVLLSTTSYSHFYITFNPPGAVADYSWWVDNFAAGTTTSQAFGATSGIAGIPFVRASEDTGSGYGFFNTLILAGGITYGTVSYVPVISNSMYYQCGYYLTCGSWKKSAEISAIQITAASGTFTGKIFLFRPKW